MDFEDEVEAGWAVARREDAQPTVEYFSALLARFPEDARALFELARAFDSAGNPEQAAVQYERALAAGLEGDRLRRCLLQYGSTLRNLGRAEEAVRMLERANTTFPASDGVRAFLSLALLSAGRANDAVAELLDLALDRIDSEDMKRYRWALRHYAAALRRGYWSAADDDGRSG